MIRLNIEKYCSFLVNWLQGRAKKAGAKGAVLGVSGGVDSAVVSVLCARAFGRNTLGLIMPCYSDENDIVDARSVMEKFQINYQIIVLDSIFDEFLRLVDKSENSIACANIKPRLRMATLYYYAAINNYLVVGSENKSELTVGYFTKYGDGGADLWPIGNLVKTQVKKLGLYLEIPQVIIDKVPTAGLWHGQTDEDEMGITYDELDKYILTGECLNPETRNRIEILINKSNHKRQLPYVPKLKLC